MSETNVQNVDKNALADLFPEMGNLGTASGDMKARFGGQDTNVNLFDAPAIVPPVVAQPAAPVTGVQPATPAQAEPPKTEADILGTGVEPAKPAVPLNDLSTYYQDRIKSGKFVAIEDTDENGKSIPFIPKTAEDYDEVLELQINYKLQQAKQELQDKWYASKSPAWKVIGQFAEMVDDPAQLIPFIQGVKTLQSVGNLDETNIDGAEQIVRTRLSQNGDPDDVIARQIDALKTTDKLIEQAKVYKPLMIQQETLNLQRMKHQEAENEKKYIQLVSEIRESALKSIEAPMFGKTKLKNEEKAAIYDLIGEPAEETQGYGIYNAIDQLFDKKNFELLAQVALLIANKDSFYNYLGTNVANQTAASLERKLRLAGEARSSSGNDFHEEQQARVARNQFKTKPSFGRG